MTVELICVAMAVYFEARNQPTAGQVAVAQVVMNRVRDSRFPNTACEVVTEPWQFSFYWDGKSDEPYEEHAWSKAKLIADAVMHGSGHVELEGVVHYHANYVSPYWSRAMHVTVEIGDHVFYTEA